MSVYDVVHSGQDKDGVTLTERMAALGLKRVRPSGHELEKAGSLSICDTTATRFTQHRCGYRHQGYQVLDLAHSLGNLGALEMGKTFDTEGIHYQLGEIWCAQARSTNFPTLCDPVPEKFQAGAPLTVWMKPSFAIQGFFGNNPDVSETSSCLSTETPVL